MDGFFRFLFAVIAAINSATGAPLNSANMPDRPAIAVPTLAPLPTLSPTGPTTTTAISGTITNIQDGFVFVSGVPVSVGPETQVNGQLRAGSFVQVRATIRADGELEADQLDIGEEPPAPQATVRPTEQPQADTSNNLTVKPTAILESKPATSPQVQPTEKPETQPTEKPEVKPTSSLAVQPTEKPEVKPAAQPTEKPDVKSSDQPEVQPTEKSNSDNGSSKNNGSGQTGGTDSGKSGNPGTNSDSSRSGDDNKPGD